jgi:hypothetical protein
LFQQLTEIEDYTGALRGYVKTDMGRRTMFDLARWGGDLRADHIMRYQVDGSMVAELDPPATFAAEPRAMRKLIGQITGRMVSSAGGTEP